MNKAIAKVEVEKERQRINQILQLLEENEQADLRTFQQMRKAKLIDHEIEEKLLENPLHGLN